MSKVLIVEPRTSGHLLVYVRLLVDEALRRGDEVVLALAPNASETAEYALHLAPVVDRVLVDVVALPLTLRSLQDQAKKCDANLVVVPHADEVASRLGLSIGQNPNVRLRLLIMRDPRWDEEGAWRHRARRMLKLSMLGLAAKVRNVDIVWLKGPSHANVEGSLAAVDPYVATISFEETQSRAQTLRKAWESVEPTFWFLITGAVSPRKNPSLIINALLDLKERLPEARLGLAIIGPCDPVLLPEILDGLQSLEDAGVRTFVNNQHITNDEMNIAVAAADAVVMAYSTSAPNSTLGKALVLGTSIVSAGSRTFQSHAAPLGAYTADLEMESLSQAMQAAKTAARPVARPSALGTESFTDALLGHHGEN
ncbi:hypothetical protein [Frigoribacterium faeni]|uniref:hypothetical protein n=1 Tax=Frigoribacterium faeni TaxID=145483 RepID=UPI002413426A|nr:hypothetical protein [Frigoribacterium faeni]